MPDTTTKCQKIKYESREVANAEERAMRKKGRVRQRPYPCEHPECKSKGIWHLSTNPKTDRVKGGSRSAMVPGARPGDGHYRTSHHKPRLQPG
jgi:hypothetical protein